MKKLLILSVLVLFSSCKLFKKVSKGQTKSQEEILVKTTRKGDTVTYVVPRIKYKDTTIISVNRVGSRIETRYNNNGDIDKIDCLTANVDELTRIIKSLEEKNKNKEEKAKPDSGFWFLIILAVGVVLVIAKKI